MKAIDRLRRDHQLLRSKLDVVEVALQMGSEAWFVIREVCFTLSRQLQDHIQREEALVADCLDALEEGSFPQLAVEHRDEPQLLRTINRLFVDQHAHSLELVRSPLTLLITGLRRHMAEEENELFPAIEQILIGRKQAGTNERVSPSGVHESMTVNHVISQYPMTKLLFHQLFINIAFEGYDCLDEVAWRHGMECSELFARLEAVISSGVRSRREQEVLIGQGKES